jgi:Bacterial PH domain
MDLEKSRAKLVSDIWQAFAQSGVDLSAVPTEQQEVLVNKIADKALLSMDKLLDQEISQIPFEPEPVDDGLEEHILWEGRPFLSMVERYTLTSERLKITHGMIGRKVENFELIRMQDIDYKQNVGERITNLGDITIRGQDASEPMVVLRNIANPEDVYETLRKAWLEARKRHGLQFREYM